MKYATDYAFRTALEARIKQGQSDSAGVSRLRKRIVFERLLARLVAQAPGEWVLKANRQGSRIWPRVRSGCAGRDL